MAKPLQRPRRIQVYVTEDEHRIIRLAAADADKLISEWARERLLEAAQIKADTAVLISPEMYEDYKRLKAKKTGENIA